MKAAWTQAFGIERKYEKFPGLILAYVWNLSDRERAVTYAMGYADALAVADAMGWTRTASWERGGYSTSQPSQRLLRLLGPFSMGQGSWRRIIVP